MLRFCLLALVSMASLTTRLWSDDVAPQLPVEPGVWTGADLWANPMEDWSCRPFSGESVATTRFSGGDRELVLLAAELNDQLSPFRISATFQLDSDQVDAEGFLGFQIGLVGEFDDFRDSAIYGSGFCAGVRGNGSLFIGSSSSGDESRIPIKSDILEMSLDGIPGSDNTFDLKLTVGDQEFWNRGVHPSWLRGLVSFTISSEPPNPAVIRQLRPDRVPAIAQRRGGNWTGSVWNMRLVGDKVTARPDRRFGPIYWCQHTLESSGQLNLQAQFAPVTAGQSAKLFLDGQLVATESMDPDARVAQFRVANIDLTVDHQYLVRWGDAEFQGIIRREPINRDQLVVAALSCNDSTGFPHSMLVANVSEHRPDVIAFLGDQIYEPIGGYGLLMGENNSQYDDRTTVCYLRKFAMHGWTWRELLRDTPSITIPDDHDVFHGNIWGAGGKLADRSVGSGAEAQDSGGYKMPARFVNAVHRTQTGNLPKPFDPTPALNGISVYYTDWQYAGLDMAIIADRQFKSAPREFLPESQIRNGWPQNHEFQRPALRDPGQLDVPKAELWGQRQESFLETWSQQKNDAAWRVVFSATPLITVQTIPADQFSDAVVPNLPRMRLGEYPENDIPKLDYDSNGWPQSKRNRAVELITSARAIHVTGDQHLGTTGQYGVAQFDEDAWWVSTPAIANLWPRRWFPQEAGQNRRPQAPKYTGQFADGFGNRITLHAVANPHDIDREPSRLFDRAVGYAILGFERTTGHIETALWPYYSAPGRSAPDNQPYPGWPIVIDPIANRRVD